MSVYNPTGSGSVHTDKVISGGRGKVAARKANPFAKKAAAGKVPAKKMPAKAVGKKAAPFQKAMSDAACPPGSMSGGAGTSSGLGAVKKTPAKKATAKAMGEVGVSTPRGQRNAVTAKTRANKKLPSQSRIAKGSTRTTGSREN